MDLDEFRAAHPPKKEKEIKLLGSPPPRTTVMGPHRPVKNMSNLDAGLCPICQAMVKEVGPKSKLDFRIVFYVCVENESHRFSRAELDRVEPSAVQKEAWAAL